MQSTTQIMSDSADPDVRPEWPRTNARGYSILEKPSGTKRPIRVIAVGAGASGIDLAHAVDTRAEKVDLTIYERLPDVGGCWYTSRCAPALPSYAFHARLILVLYDLRYPGCACDIPAGRTHFRLLCLLRIRLTG
jgi:cation diffusion facilitator CzcD-associated flavoprotein CzcO